MKIVKAALSRFNSCSLFVIAFGMCADAFGYDDWIDSWNPPPKEYTVTSVHYPSDGSLPMEADMPNLCGTHIFRRSSGTSITLAPIGAPRPRNEQELLRYLSMSEEDMPVLRNGLPATAALNGYGVNYPNLNRGDIIPLLSHLFYVTEETELHRFEDAHEAYRRLRFLKESTFSFPYEQIATPESRKAGSEGDQESSIPAWGSCHNFRGHRVIIRDIRRESAEEAAPLQVQLAVVSYATASSMHDGPPTDAHYMWYSVGDELPIPWAFPVSGTGDSDRSNDKYITTDLKYFRIANIVPPNSAAIEVQHEDGGEPIECRPIGWIDIGIQGREPQQPDPAPISVSVLPKISILDENETELNVTFTNTSKEDFRYLSSSSHPPRPAHFEAYLQPDIDRSPHPIPLIIENDRPVVAEPARIRTLKPGESIDIPIRIPAYNVGMMPHGYGIGHYKLRIKYAVAAGSVPAKRLGLTPLWLDKMIMDIDKETKRPEKDAPPSNPPSNPEPSPCISPAFYYYTILTIIALTLLTVLWVRRRKG